jgi:hypothetical protein
MANASFSKSKRSSIGRGGRLVGTRELKKTIWIVVEGEKTEKIYFNKFRKMADLAATEVKVVHCTKGTSATQIVEEGIKLLEQAFPRIDEVWCVFDKEGRNCERNFKSAMQLFKLQSTPDGKRLHCAVSNPCFEFWILLHEEKTAKPFSNCNEVRNYQKKRMPLYTKTNRSEIEKICLSANKAVQHAAWLRIQNVECPSTDVDLLIVALSNENLKVK